MSHAAPEHFREKSNGPNPSQRKKVGLSARINDHRTAAILQAKRQAMIANSAPVQRMRARQAIIQKRATDNGLPPQLKAGIENLSGIVMDDVRVHYNSPKPAQLQAHAYAQGTDIHLAPGQEKHLPHEAWHVVQQKQGRVRPTKQLKGKVNINDDAGLEREADVMGEKAIKLKSSNNYQLQKKQISILNVQFNGKKRKKFGELEPTNFKEKVGAFSAEIFVGDEFLEAHIRQYAKLKGETEASYALQEGRRRNLPSQTVIFIDGVARKNLFQEARTRNLTKFYYKKIQKNGGVPAETFFYTDQVYHFITVHRVNGENYAVQTEAIGRIEYTVKNIGKSVDGIPLFMINHLESMASTRLISNLPTQVEEISPELDLDSEIIEDETAQFLSKSKSSRLIQRRPKFYPFPIVQRVITITKGEKPKKYDTDSAMGVLFSKGLVKNVDFANEIELQIKKFDKENRTFVSIEEMFETAKRALENDEDEESDGGEVEFSPGFWEDEKIPHIDLKEEGFEIGPSLRKEQGMDYKTVDKDAFSVKGHPDLALVIRIKRPKGAGSITQEVKTLKALATAKLPTAKIIRIGFYPKSGMAYPCLLMKRYITSSKTLVRRVKGHLVVNENYSENISVFKTPEMCKNGIQSLMEIRSSLRSNSSLAVDDIQFLVDEQGNFFINDASQMDFKNVEANLEVISELIRVLEERENELKMTKEKTVEVKSGDKTSEKKNTNE